MRNLILSALLLFALSGIHTGCDDAPATSLPTTDSTGRLLVTPTNLDFATVSHESSSTAIADLRNTSGSTISVDRIRIVGHPGFTISISDVDYFNANEDRGGSTEVSLAKALTLLPDSRSEIEVTYTPTAPEPATGSVTFLVSAPNESATSELRFSANISAPCISRNPSRIVFGETIVGASSSTVVEIASCNAVGLDIHNIDLIDNPNNVFRVDTAQNGPFPIAIPAFTSIFIPVTYEPKSVASPDRAPTSVSRLRISSNAYYSDMEINVEVVADLSCSPTAEIAVLEGDQVPSRTVLHLSGRDSAAMYGPIMSWEWSVAPPAGSASAFVPGPFVRDPSYEVDTAGEYVFRLNVRDAFGTLNCTPAEQRVTVL